MYGQPPGALVAHSAVLVGQELFVWGGGDAVHAHEPLHLIDTTSFLWNRPVTTGNEPMAHVGHSAVHAGTSMAVFGGYGHRQYWNELVGPNPNPMPNPNPDPDPDPDPDSDPDPNPNPPPH